MLRTRTDLWALTFMSGLGLAAGCGARASHGDAEGGSTAGIREGMPHPCEGGEPILYGSVHTGLEICPDGVVHRPAPVECPNNLALRTPPKPLEHVAVECESDADCTAAEHGYCDYDRMAAPPLHPPLECHYGCVTDADCGEDRICVCGSPIGECKPATCRSDADCEEGLLCAEYVDPEDVCGYRRRFACQTAEDECRVEADCPTGEHGGSCTVIDERWACEEHSGVVCGRPFLVCGEQRLASLGSDVTDDWRAQLSATPAHVPSASLRQMLGETWSEIALMEHASIAAFARFTLQLMQLGAPHELILQSQHAMLDETRHAELCFALASHYLAKPCAPGPLDVHGALERADLLEVVRLVLREGCVGETVAALEASEAEAHCTDPAVSAVLAQISADERRHAELAWRFVRWALDKDARVASVLRSECERVERELHTPLPSEPNAHPESANYGVLSPTLRAEVRRVALAQVVLPCARALLASSAVFSGSAPRVAPQAEV